MRIHEDNFIRHFKRGKEEALVYVIDLYAGLVKAVIFNALRSYDDPHIIEECVNDTFLGAYENAKQFKGDAEDFRKWICTIAKFKAVDKQRMMAKLPIATELDGMERESQSAEDEYLLQASHDELLRMMASLPDIDRDIFTMKYFLNMRNNEIAERLGLTKAAVDNRLYRGKKRMQEIRLGGIPT